ncbi:hypothetical protein SAY87_004690 [Trapa incisa]|uniref:Uncharacterized protein n=1 Tax=Trapa incisa TaxID=236973 RepID=A0AAN7JUH0_9MYRT|nr:hypothetical protein SAY87_004690 [Trapa incisa]
MVRFLHKAALVTQQDQINADGSPVNSWQLGSMQQVEEAAQADRQFGNTSFKIPASSYVVFLMLTLTIFIPIYDRFLVPFLQRLTGKEGGITVLHRMGIGFIVAT